VIEQAAERDLALGASVLGISPLMLGLAPRLAATAFPAMPIGFLVWAYEVLLERTVTSVNTTQIDKINFFIYLTCFDLDKNLKIKPNPIYLVLGIFRN
jgi:hypothetical protein